MQRKGSTPMTDEIALVDIVENGRHRRDLGDIKVLARSIRAVGLLHPVVVRPDGTLIAGKRRLEAARLLGWQKIPVHVVDIDNLVEAEAAENAVRKGFTLSEAAAIYRTLVSQEREKARERMGSPANFSELELGRSRDKAANGLGFSGVTMQKIVAVVEAAEESPSDYQELVDRMDRTGKVDGIYHEFLLRRRRRIQKPEGDLPADIDLRHGDLRDVLQDIPDGSVDLILTDPPYAEEYLPAWEDLALFAKRTLKPGHLLVAYAGHYHLPRVMTALAGHIEYLWIGSVGEPGPNARIYSRRIRSGWRPVLFYSNGAYESKHWFRDAYTSDGKDKTHDPMQQCAEPFKYLAEHLTNRGDLVVDPFVGSGTTALVCQELGRSFIGCDVNEESVRIARGRVSGAEASQRPEKKMKAMASGS